MYVGLYLHQCRAEKETNCGGEGVGSLILCCEMNKVGSV